MKIQHGVALTIEDQIDAVETAYHELSRIMYSSGFNWHIIPECAELFPFEEFCDYHDKLWKIYQKLEELKKKSDETSN